MATRAKTYKSLSNLRDVLLTCVQGRMKWDRPFTHKIIPQANVVRMVHIPPTVFSSATKDL